MTTSIEQINPVRRLELSWGLSLDNKIGEIVVRGIDTRREADLVTAYSWLSPFAELGSRPHLDIVHGVMRVTHDLSGKEFHQRLMEGYPQ